MRPAPRPLRTARHRSVLLPLAALPLVALAATGCRRVSWQLVAEPPPVAADEGTRAEGLTADPSEAGVIEGHLRSSRADVVVRATPATADR